MSAEIAALALVETINATGGIVYTRTAGVAEPVGDRQWSDLADAYLKACDALGLEPCVNPDPEAGLG